MDEKKCQAILEKYRKENGSVVSILQDIQEKFGYIVEDAVNWFAYELNIPASSFFGVATFYSQFYLKPRGKNIVTACCGTACQETKLGQSTNWLVIAKVGRRDRRRLLTSCFLRQRFVVAWPRIEPG